MGPYLSERQWGTVREDYSENGDACNFFIHDQARSRAYRWGEDGLAGLGTFCPMKVLLQAGRSGLVPVRPEKRFLISCCIRRTATGRDLQRLAAELDAD